MDECIVLIMKGPHSYTKEDGTKVYALDVVMNEHYFADDKIPEEVRNNQNAYQPANSFDVPDYSPNPMTDSMSMPVVDPIPEIPTGMNIPEGLPEDFPIGE